jgi:6-phosphofructokinase 2
MSQRPSAPDKTPATITVVTLTMSPAVDMFATTEHFYHDSKTRCTIVQRLPGGGGINVARNLRRMGLAVKALYPAGGHHGDLLDSMLAAEGLPVLRIPVANETTQNIALTETDSGRNLHLVFPGARLAEEEWQSCLEAISCLSPAPQVLVISGSLPEPVPRDFFAKAIQICHDRGVKVVLDTSGPALRAALNAGVFLVKLNREDFAALGYEGNDTPQQRIQTMRQMVAEGMAEHMVLTLGPDGALLANIDGDALHAQPPPVTVISHAGAGDSFVSVMTCRLQQGFAPRQAFAYGVAAAAAAISTPGNQLEDLNWLEEVYRGITVREL